MPVFAFANQKGGVGKTSSCVNISAALALAGHKVLLADMDPQGNATSGLGVDRGTLSSSIYDLLLDAVDVDSVCCPTSIEGLDLLPATIDLAGAEIEIAPLAERESLLKRKIEPLREQYDYIIIDCPPSLGLMTLNALVASDSIIIPIQAEFYALEGLSQLVKTVQVVSRRMNPRLHILGILLTMFDGRTNLSLQVAEEVKKYFGSKVFRTVIPRTVKLSEAPSFGEPVLTYAPKSKGAEAYKKLSREVLKRE